MYTATIRAVNYYLPPNILSNEQLAEEYPEWSAERIQAKTGIVQRHIAAPEETAEDLALAAAQRLIAQNNIDVNTIEFIIVCSQSATHRAPSMSCLLQSQLKIPQTAGALDINLGCSGYVYSLAVAKGLIESGQVANVLLVTADTYSKFFNKEDYSGRTLFGDGATATLIERDEHGFIGPFIFGTDGDGAQHLGIRNESMHSHFYMNGPEVFRFTLDRVPELIAKLLNKAACQLEDIDLFIFHQANQFMLEHLRKKLNIPEEKFYIGLAAYGNTVASSIPIALADVIKENPEIKAKKIMLVGFGIGYSWCGALCQLN